jgi:aminoglycoside phosphotransferase (APT) family kinase protein
MGSMPRERPGEEAALVRALPPEATLRWLLDALGATAVLSCEPMRGGSTSALHRVTVGDDRNATSTVVLRRYVLDSYLASEPAAPFAEVTGLELAGRLSLPTPDLLAADPHGAHCDAPTIVMRFLAGRSVWELGLRRIEELVDALVEIHAVDLAGVDTAPMHGYPQESYRPPRWATSPKVWERAVEILHGPIPERDVGFAHRDFHPGNVLWQRRRLTGVVDWQAACRAPASIDVSHCRLNFAYYDATLPEVLRVTWQTRSGRTFEPWADIASIIGALDGLRDTPPGAGARQTIDDMLTRAVAEHGP